jgi:adenine-specific DNA-methyltransferase
LDDWENMIVLGDNLPVLRSLLCLKQQGALLNSDRTPGVRLAYIDPPFSTSNEYRVGLLRTATISSSLGDETAYSDALVGTEYLEFLRQRLVFLRELLADNGSIYVHIDCKMGHYVKILMDEVFGADHFVNDITRIKCNPKNFARRGYGNIKDMVLFYARGDSYVWNDSTEAMDAADMARLFPKVDPEGRRYATTPLHAPGETQNGPTGAVWKGLRPPPGRHWRYTPEELTRLDEAGLIEWSRSGNPRKKIYADEASQRGKKRQDVWRFKDPAYPRYPTEKNQKVLQAIVEASSNPGDIALDWN